MSAKSMLVYTVLFVSPFISTGFAVPTDYKAGEVIIKFAPKAGGIQRSVAERNQTLGALNAGEVKHCMKLVPGRSLVQLPANLTVSDALKKLKNNADILYVEPNYRIRTLTTFPNDPYGPNSDPCDGGEQWGLRNTGQTGGTVDADIDGPEAWDIITDASNVIVAVIDTGVDYTHPDLAPNMWVNQAEVNSAPDYDDDGNGYKDDI